MDIQTIRTSLDSIRKIMDERVELANPTGVAEKLESLSAMVGLSAECVANARKQYDLKLMYLAKSVAYKSYSATDKKMIFAGEASEEIYLVNYAEAINKDLHYCIESLRTLISYLKEELNQTKR